MYEKKRFIVMTIDKYLNISKIVICLFCVSGVVGQANDISCVFLILFLFGI